MTYRPYPSPDRARHQLARHVHYEDAPQFTMSPTVARFAAAMREAFPPNAGRIMANVRAMDARKATPAALSDPGSST